LADKPDHTEPNEISLTETKYMKANYTGAYISSFFVLYDKNYYMLRSGNAGSMGVSFPALILRYL
jgi:hypothetical protein